MRCSSQPLPSGGRGAGRGLLKAVMLACALALAAVPSAHAQSPAPPPIPRQRQPTPSPTPLPVPTMINSEISAGNQALNLGSSFLERLGNQATNGFDQSLRNNPGGGGASEATQGPRYRTWGELYGLSTRTDAQGGFFGDHRRTTGGVAGFGAQIVPHVNIGSRSTRATPKSMCRWRCRRRRSTSRNSDSMRRSTRDHGPGRSRWCTASAISAPAATPALALRMRVMARASTAR